jgi:hypothetical protein
VGGGGGKTDRGYEEVRCLYSVSSKTQVSHFCLSVNQPNNRFKYVYIFLYFPSLTQQQKKLFLGIKNNGERNFFPLHPPPPQVMLTY